MRYARAMDESTVNHNRRSRRSPVLLAATVEVGGTVHNVKLRNLSAEGALVEGAENLPEYAAITFCRKDLRVRARIAWVQGKYAGIAFDKPLEPTEVLRHIPRRESKSLPAKLFARPAVSRHNLSEGDRQWIQDWMTANAVDRPGE
jgi:hypothetical protein